jgi:hypothetical protein
MAEDAAVWNAWKLPERFFVMPPRRELTVPYALSGLLAVLLLASSVVGLLLGGRGFYDTYPASLAGLVGQDAVTLVVGVPLLLGTMWLTGRGSIGALLVWAGSLFYFAYSYYFYVIGGFNAIVSASLFGLLSLLFAIDAEALRTRFGPGAPTRTIGGFFVGISLLFALMWGGMVVSGAVAGVRPDEVLRSVVIIDCTVLLPLLFFGGLRLWRGGSWGYVLGGVLLTKVAVTGFTLAFTTALGALWAGRIGGFDAFLFVVFALMAIGALLFIVRYMRSIREIGKAAPVEVHRGTRGRDV